MHQTPTTKLKNLKANLKQMQSALIAYSGGTDSAFLIKVAHDTLGKNAAAVTKLSPAYPKEQLNDAKQTAKQTGIKHIIITSKPDDIRNLKKNPKDRCYHCKKQLYKDLKQIAKKQNIKNILDGTNYDDKKSKRPGMQAIRELDIKTPLKDAKLTKEDIRHLSKKINLETWNKPRDACLATRFPPRTEITDQNLKKIEKAENLIRTLGIKQLRVRYHDNLARIEITRKDIPKLLKQSKKITSAFKKLGFIHITLDIESLKEENTNKV